VRALPLADRCWGQRAIQSGIQGTITDTGGGLVPEAKVTSPIRDREAAGGHSQPPEGFLQISGLPPGKYTACRGRENWLQEEAA